MNSARGLAKYLLMPALVAVLLLSGPALSLHAAKELPARVTDISSEDYFPAVLREINSAKESIVVAMYSFMVFESSSATSPPVQLLQGLVRAHKRGVGVRVILGLPYSYDVTKGRRDLDMQNETARQMLHRAGVDVRYAVGGKTMHQKLVVIDGRTVIVGSTNWSRPALTKNWEASVLIRSEKLAAEMLERIGKIELKDMPAERPAEKTVCIPERFLTDRSLVPAMYAVNEDTGFDIFLLLWRQRVEKQSRVRGGMSVDLDEIARQTGRGDKARSIYREEIKIAMERLRDKYGLIEFKTSYGGDATVWMTRDGLKRPRKGSGLPIPEGYWDHGWSRKLSMRGKVLYLICLAEEQSSATSPWWSLSQKDIAKKYLNPKSIKPVNDAVDELERMDVLQVTRHHPPKGKDWSMRHPNTYRLNPLLSEERIAREWKVLEDAFGKKKTAKARELAKMLEKPHSRETAQGFLWAMEEYGTEAVEKKTREVAKLRPGNACRNVAYVMYLLKRG